MKNEYRSIHEHWFSSLAYHLIEIYFGECIDSAEMNSLFFMLIIVPYVLNWLSSIGLKLHFGLLMGWFPCKMPPNFCHLELVIYNCGWTTSKKFACLIIENSLNIITYWFYLPSILASTSIKSPWEYLLRCAKIIFIPSDHNVYMLSENKIPSEFSKLLILELSSYNAISFQELHKEIQINYIGSWGISFHSFKWSPWHI